MNIYLLTYMGLASCNQIPQLFVWLRSLWGSGYYGGYTSSGGIAISFGGAAIVVAMLHQGSLHLWLGGVMPSGMSSWSRGIWGWPGFLCGMAHCGALRREGYNCCFAGLFCYWWQSVHFGWGTGRWAIILWILGSVLIFPNFLRS